MTPRRRADDARTDPDPDALEKWWRDDLPRTIRGLEEGRTLNRRLIYFIIAMFLLGGYIVDQWDDQRQRDIKKVREQFYLQCLAINDNARGINSAVNQAIKSIQTSDTLTQREKAEGVASWENVRQQLPLCHSP